MIRIIANIFLFISVLYFPIWVSFLIALFLLFKYSAPEVIFFWFYVGRALWKFR